MNHTIRFALRLAAVTFGIAIILFLLKNFAEASIVHPQYGVILAFLYLLSVSTAAFVNYGIEKQPDKFNVFFFPALIFRFFASIIFILVIIFMKLPDMLYFVLDFFVLYLLYQVFEITSIMTNLRSHLRNRGNEEN